jgi:hypothetical protein
VALSPRFYEIVSVGPFETSRGRSRLRLDLRHARLDVGLVAGAVTGRQNGHVRIFPLQSRIRQPLKKGSQLSERAAGGGFHRRDELFRFSQRTDGNEHA